jgi:gliding motility-associated-like protein
MRKILRGHVFNIRFLLTLCLGFACSAIHAQVSGTFTINSAVATGGTNFQTFTAAAAALAGGVNGAVTFNVQAGSGPYNEQVLLSNITGTSATNTITFNCNGVTLTFNSPDPMQRAGVKLNNTDYVTFDNLVVDCQAANWGEYGCGFHLLNDADHNTIKNCKITTLTNVFDPYANEGIVINGNDNSSIDEGDSKCDDNLIQGNVVDGGGNGISIMSIPPFGNQPKLITGNKVLNNKVSNTVINCIQVCYTSGTLVNGNEIVGGFNNYNTTGVLLGNYNESVVISNNRIHDITGSVATGISVASTSTAGKESLVANNLIYNFITNGEQAGISAVGADCSYLNVFNNTISLDDQTLSGDNTYGFHFASADNVTIKNNIVTVSRPVIFNNFGIYLDGAVSNFLSEQNDIFLPPSATFVSQYGNYVGNPYPTVIDWRLDMKMDYFSTDVDPAYTNPAAFNFKPTAKAIDNMAVYVNINNDIDNVARNTTTPDPGCYEFTSAACSTPVVAGTTFVTPDSSMCVGPKISLGVRGNSSGGGQTYTWQTASSATGTFTNLTGAIGYPYYEGSPLTTLYYRVATTCGGSTVYSNPIRVLVTSPLNPGTYTINNALPTAGINFNSFSDMAHALICGINGPVVFNVANGSGPYNEQMIIPAVNTSPTRTVTINGNGATISYTPNDQANSAVIKLDGSDYFTIDSLNVVVGGATTSGYGFGIQLINDADHNTIKRCKIDVNITSTSDLYAGIVINGNESNPNSNTIESYCDSNLITGNKITGGYYGIACVTKSDFALTASTSLGNIISKNKLIDNGSKGIYISGVDNLLIDSNDISHANRSVFATKTFYGIMAYQKNFALAITRNRIHDLFVKATGTIEQLTGIRFENDLTTAAKPNIVSNNEVYNFKKNVIQEGLYTLSSNYIKFYHNTISLDDTTTYSPSFATRGFSAFGTTSFPGIEVKDNIFTIKRGTDAAKYCIYMIYNDSAIAANYNNYYIRSYSAAGAASAKIGFMGLVDYPTLTNWLATRKDSASVNIDPVYNDVAKGDLTPTKVLFENRGSGVGITNDIVNATRNTTKPDIGAIEFTICSPLTKPVVAVEDAETNIIKFAWTSVPNTTGYRVSRDKLNWTIPSSGAMGLSHTVTGLKPTDKITLWVKALGTRADCPEYISDSTEGQALTDGVFVPNTFTPNGDTHNDYFKVYSNVTKTIHWMVFNQWGEKIFESNDIQAQWDGTYKGKPQPVGVYVYVVSGMLTDGTKVSQKGTFNLVR